MPDYIVQIFYFVSVLFVAIGLRKLTAKASIGQGIVWAGIGILMSIVCTFSHNNLNANYVLLSMAILLGGGVALIIANQVSLVNSSKLTAFFGGMGGGAAALILFLELMNLELISLGLMSDKLRLIAVVGILVGSVSFIGCLTIFAKHQGIFSKETTFPMQQWINALLLVVTITFGAAIIINGNQFDMSSLVLFLVFSLTLGLFVTFPVRYSDLSMLVSLYISLAAFAIALAGYVLNILPMFVLGTLIASTSFALTMRTAKSINRSVWSVLFDGASVVAVGSQSGVDDFSFLDDEDETPSVVNETTSNDLAVMLAYANKVIIVPGYGMAVSQAQERLWELTKLLRDKGVNIKFAIHPAAGRMSGHMNVLLAETGLTYDSLFDLSEINDEFSRVDVVLVIGANDIVNPKARNDQSSSLFGVPILNADKARNVVVVKRGNGMGYSQNENPLFGMDNTKMLYGDAEFILTEVLSDIKAV